jgi:hypothetical protein
MNTIAQLHIILNSDRLGQQNQHIASCADETEARTHASAALAMETKLHYARALADAMQFSSPLEQKRHTNETWIGLSLPRLTL